MRQLTIMLIARICYPLEKWTSANPSAMFYLLQTRLRAHLFPPRSSHNIDYDKSGRGRLSAQAIDRLAQTDRQRVTPGLLRSRRSVIPHGETGDLSPNVGHINIYSLTDLAAVRGVLDCVRRAHPFGPHHLVVNRVPNLKVIHGNFCHVTAPVLSRFAHHSAFALASSLGTLQQLI